MIENIEDLEWPQYYVIEGNNICILDFPYKEVITESHEEIHD